MPNELESLIYLNQTLMAAIVIGKYLFDTMDSI